MLLQLGTDKSLSALIQRVKAVTAKSINEQAGRSGSVWAAGFHDRALRREDDLPAVAR